MDKVNKEQTELTLEALFEKLDHIVEHMESEALSLDETFSLYQQGVEMLRQCNAKLDLVEKKVLLLENDGELHEF